MGETGYYTGTSGTAASNAQFTAGVLQAALSVRKVTAIVAPAWSGPQLDSYLVSLPLGVRPEEIENLAGALAIAAGAPSCRVARGEGKLILEIPKPARKRTVLKAARLDALKPPAATAIAMGVSTGGAVLWVDIGSEQNAHIILGGTTGSGKSVLLRWMIHRLAMQNPVQTLRFVMLDPKRLELRMFAHLPHLLHPVTSAPLEIGRVLSWVEGELDRRMESGRVRPRIVVVIEEVADVLARNRQAGDLLARLCQVGRACAISVLASTQQPGASSLGPAIVNFPTRILGRVSSGTLTYGASGRRQTAADMLLGRGDMLLVAAGETVRFQAPLADDAQFRRLPATETVASLEDQLPAVVAMADLQRDRRGGHTRRDLDAETYQQIEQALADGASADDLKRRFSIGSTRASRLRDEWLAEGEQ